MSTKWRVHIPLNFCGKMEHYELGGSAVFSGLLEEPHYPQSPKVPLPLSQELLQDISVARETGQQRVLSVFCSSVPSHLCYLCTEPQRGSSPDRQHMCLFRGGLPSSEARSPGGPCAGHIESRAGTRPLHTALRSQ